MNNKNLAKVLLLTLIVTALVLGTTYVLTNQRTPVTESTLRSNRKTEEVIPVAQTTQKSQSTQTTKTEEKEVKPVFEVGETVLIYESMKPLKCSSNGNPCENILITTEIDVTQPSSGKELTGRFFIRAYDGKDYKNSPKIGELQITQNYNPFGGDGGQISDEKRYEEILTIKSSEKPSVANELQFSVELQFKEKFYLEYLNSVPGWDSPGYVLRLEKEGKESIFDFNGRLIDFYYSNGVLNINVPQ